MFFVNSTRVVYSRYGIQRTECVRHIKYRNICKNYMRTYSCIQHIQEHFYDTFWVKNPVYAVYRSKALKYFEQKSCMSGIQEYRPRNLVQYSCIIYIFAIALDKSNVQKSISKKQRNTFYFVYALLHLS